MEKTEKKNAGAICCSRCSKEMHCGAEAGENTCWCQDLPPLQQANLGGSCYCRACLMQLLAAEGAG